MPRILCIACVVIIYRKEPNPHSAVCSVHTVALPSAACTSIPPPPPKKYIYFSMICGQNDVRRRMYAYGCCFHYNFFLLLLLLFLACEWIEWSERMRCFICTIHHTIAFIIFLFLKWDYRLSTIQRQRYHHHHHHYRRTNTTSCDTHTYGSHASENMAINRKQQSLQINQMYGGLIYTNFYYYVQQTRMPPFLDKLFYD